MRTTFELLKLLEGNRFAIYNFTDKELVSLKNLTYKIASASGISYYMVVKLHKRAASLMYNKPFNVLGLTLVNEPNKSWVNLTIYSIDDSMFRGILNGYHDIDKMWPKVYRYFKSCGVVSQEMFIYFCKTQLNMTEFDWN